MERQYDRVIAEAERVITLDPNGGGAPVTGRKEL
jgi:hypothetical protein